MEGGTIPLNGWSHVAMAYEPVSGRFAIYINGERVASTIHTGNLLVTDRNVAIGKEESILPRFFPGLIDEVEIFTAELTQGQIQAIYNAGPAGKCKPGSVPPNNDFANAQPISGSIGTVSGINVGANKQTGEPSHGGNAGGASVWYRWQAPASGPAYFNTLGSDFDTLLGIYTGSSVNALTLIGGNDDFVQNDIGYIQSQVRFAAVAGTVYYIAVDGKAGATGNINLRWGVSSAAACVNAPSGMVGWFPGDGNANDVQGANHGTLQNGAGYTGAVVAQGFSLDGVNDHISVPASASLNTQSMTIDAWIYPTDLSIRRPIVEYAAPTGLAGVHFWQSAGSAGGFVPGALYANVRDTSGGNHSIATSTSVLRTNEWSHIAFTFDKTSGSAAIYVNGASVAVADLGASVIPQTSLPLLLGARPVGSGDTFGGSVFSGVMDEVEIFNRALSISEIQSIYNAATYGKCKPGQGPTPTATPTPTPTPVAGTAIYQINSGGPVVAPFAADNFVTGGATFTTTAAINVSGAINPAPAAVYQTDRYGTFTYTFPGLIPGATYTARLHFAETFHNGPGLRSFNVRINGNSALSSYDIFADAAGANKAVIKEFVVTANGSGQIVIAYTPFIDNPKSNGIEIIAGGTPGGTPTPTPSGTPTPTPACGNPIAVLSTLEVSNKVVVFPNAAASPAPPQQLVTGLPTNAKPQGISYYDSDHALVGDFLNSRIFVIQVSTSTLLDTINTAGVGYNGTGSIAASPDGNTALAIGTSNQLYAIHAPFNASSAINQITMPGNMGSFMTQGIVFNSAGRAFVSTLGGISVIDPPYNSLAFTIPLNDGGRNNWGVAITPDGSTLLTTFNSNRVGILQAPFSASSAPQFLTVPGAPPVIQLLGINITPDGSKAIVASAASDFAAAISAPFTSTSTVETLPLPTPAPGGDGGFEDVGISADGQIAILAGQVTSGPPVFIRAPFTAAGAQSYYVPLQTGGSQGRGAGAVRFQPPCPGSFPTPTPGITPTPGPTPTPGITPTPTPGPAGLTADYQFQNTRNSSAGGPALTDLITSPNGANSFPTETVDASCPPRTVLNFPKGNGLSLVPTTGLTTDNKTYSIVMLFKFTEQGHNRAIIDFKNGMDGRGIFADPNNNVAFYNSQNNGTGISVGSGSPITANRWVQVVFTRQGNDGNLGRAGIDIAYIDGVQQYVLNSNGPDGIVDSQFNTLRFFLNQLTSNQDYSGGYVARIRLFNRVLTANEVAALDRLPGGACSVATPTPTPTSIPTPTPTPTPTPNPTPTPMQTPPVCLDGALDPTFNGSGRATGNPGDGYATAMDANGKFIVVGSAVLGTSGNFRTAFGVSRYLDNGVIDTSFGTSGVVTTEFPGFSVQARGVVLQPDGKIVVAGTITATGGTSHPAVARYTPEGVLDTSFGSAGTVVTEFFFDDQSDGRGVALQPDGKIVIVGRANVRGASNALIGLARYTTSGVLDSSFDSDGKITMAFTGFPYAIPNAIAIQPDGKIVTAGRSNPSSPGNFNFNLDDFALARHNSNGTVDTSFGVNGQVVTNLNSGDEIFAIAIQPDGNIVVGGYANYPNDTFALARYTSAGVLDNGFGTGGKITTPINQESQIAAIAIQPDGKIVGAGYTRNGNVTTDDFALARFTPAGVLDLSFGTGGKLTTDFFGRFDAARGVVIQPDGKIVAVGFANDAGTSVFALARYLTPTVQGCPTASPTPTPTPTPGPTPSPVSTPTPTPTPTPSGITLTGRVTTPAGIGLRNAIVSLINAQGVRTIATTSSFGIYTLTNVPPAAGYILTVASKRYRFAPKTMDINQSMTSVDFIGLE